MSDGKQSANEELRNALRLCIEQMCARCREAADALTASIPCLTGCETLKIAKAALDRKPMNCEKYATKEEATEAFLNETCEDPCGNCTVGDSLIHECGIDWLFDKAKGATDGNK